MYRFKRTFMMAAALISALMIGGCSGTDVPSDIVVDPSTTYSSESKESSSSSEISESEPFINEEVTATVDKVAVSADNRFLGTERVFTVDDENASITLDVTYSDYVDLKTLENCFLNIEVTAGEYELDGAVNPNGSVDLTHDAYLIVTDENGKRKRYTLNVNRTVHDLPIVNIRLENLASPSTIQRYVTQNMDLYIDNTGDTDFPESEVISGTIRGRGHSSWKWPKKPYRLKFDNAVPIMGFTKNRDWILLSNYSDKSLIRNIVAYDMGHELGSFVWTATQYPVDLFINGEYQGVYAIGEQREIAKNRIELDESDDVDRGYLLEVGGADGDDMVKNYDFFHTPSNSVNFITFTDPKASKLTEEQRRFVMDYVNKADEAIVNGGDYEQYIDVDSFVDWILIHELTCNLDSCFRRSCYITKDKGGKLKLGPIWDFDHAFGNFDMDNKYYNTWFTVGTTGEDPYIHVNWCNYLMKDEKFRAKLKERWFEKRDALLSRAEKSIADNKAKINASQEENYKIWNTLGYKSGYQSWATANISTFDGQIEYLSDFIKKRAEWIDENI